MNILIIENDSNIASKIKQELKVFGYTNIDTVVLSHKNINILKEDKNIFYFCNKQFSYNTQTKEFFNNKIKISITKREIKLLELIIKNINKKYISNQELEYTIWQDKIVKNGTRRVLVHSLNRKFNSRILENDYGLGYRINL